MPFLQRALRRIDDFPGSPNEVLVRKNQVRYIFPFTRLQLSVQPVFDEIVRKAHSNKSLHAFLQLRQGLDFPFREISRNLMQSPERSGYDWLAVQKIVDFALYDDGVN